MQSTSCVVYHLFYLFTSLSIVIARVFNAFFPYLFQLYKCAPSDKTIFLEPLKFKAKRDKYKDENNNKKIYVGNFPPDKNVEDMKKYFEKYGEIEEAFFVNRYESSRNGFVSFSEQAMAQAALDDCPHFINGRFLNVARPRGRRSDEDKENLCLKSERASRSRSRRFSPY